MLVALSHACYLACMFGGEQEGEGFWRTLGERIDGLESQVSCRISQVNCSKSVLESQVSYRPRRLYSAHQPRPHRCQKSARVLIHSGTLRGGGHRWAGLADGTGRQVVELCSRREELRQQHLGRQSAGGLSATVAGHPVSAPSAVDADADLVRALQVAPAALLAGAYRSLGCGDCL